MINHNFGGDNDFELENIAKKNMKNTLTVSPIYNNHKNSK